MNPTGVGTWIGDWAWSLPLIVLTVVVHVCGLALIGERVVSVLSESANRRRFMPKFGWSWAVQPCWPHSCTESRAAFGPPRTGI